MEILLHPLVQPLALLMGMAVCLYLFITLKKELCRQERKRLREKAEHERSQAAMHAQLEALQEALREAEDRSRPASISGMNLSKRSQALRLHRRGNRPDQIAAALSIPLSEVELLLKVHQTVVGSL